MSHKKCHTRHHDEYVHNGQTDRCPGSLRHPLSTLDKTLQYPLVPVHSGQIDCQCSQLSLTVHSGQCTYPASYHPRSRHAARARVRRFLTTVDILLRTVARSAATRRRQLPTACGESPVRRASSRSLNRDSRGLLNTACILASIAASDRLRFARPVRTRFSSFSFRLYRSISQRHRSSSTLVTISC